IGAGASGMLAAGRAGELGVEVLLLEKMPEPGKKLSISGKTRCNLTNSADLDEFISAYGSNGKFLFPAFHKFFRSELLELMRSLGIETKVERGGRIFPVSDNASDVVDALKGFLKQNGVKMATGVRVMGITTDANRVTGVKTLNKDYSAKAVILATGGASFPETGSEGDGYQIARELGHTIVKLRPSLVPLCIEEIKRLDKEGVTLRNITLTAFKGRADDIHSNINKRMIIDKRFGEITLTHNSIRGPIALQMSLAIVKALESGAVRLEIDLKPALSTMQLKARLQREFDRAGKRSLRAILKELLPVKLIEPIILLSKIPG
ncbi:MAG: aminoacetone oxidase family FAD-binding enzyme, partial [Dehalococcoidales bacterium]|nr:aminoacetone oxidase family FAD-binding enzyme [Dehalococcoidales bacterium]